MRTRARLLLAALLPALALGCGAKEVADAASSEATAPDEAEAMADYLQSQFRITFETLGLDSAQAMAQLDSARAFRAEFDAFFRDSAVWAALKAEVDSASPEEKADMRRALDLLDEADTASDARMAEIEAIMDSLSEKWVPELKGVGK